MTNQNINDITTSITLSTPQPKVDNSNSNDKVITSSYTIKTTPNTSERSPIKSTSSTPPTTPIKSSSTSISNIVNESKDKGGDENISITATLNVPFSASSTNKTDLDSSATPLPPMASGRKPPTESRFMRNNLKSSEATDEVFDERNDTNVFSADFTLSSITKSIKENKRSLFDIDNASSLSLAEKLRNEANKYSEDNTTTNSTSKDTATTTEVENNDSVAQQYQSQHTSERRPSWRLKFDTGCKVRIHTHNFLSLFFLNLYNIPHQPLYIMFFFYF